MPEAVEGFLQVIGAYAFEVILKHFIESCALLIAEILGALEETVAGVAQHGFIAASVQLLCFVTPYLIDGFT